MDMLIAQAIVCLLLSFHLRHHAQHAPGGEYMGERGAKRRALTMQDVSADLGAWYGPWGRQGGRLRGARGVWCPWQQCFGTFAVCGSSCCRAWALWHALYCSAEGPEGGMAQVLQEHTSLSLDRNKTPAVRSDHYTEFYRQQNLKAHQPAVPAERQGTCDRVSSSCLHAALACHTRDAIHHTCFFNEGKHLGKLHSHSIPHSFIAGLICHEAICQQSCGVHPSRLKQLKQLGKAAWIC